MVHFLWKILAIAENLELLWCQLCSYWWHRRLSLRQPPVSPVTTELASWWFSISLINTARVIYKGYFVCSKSNTKQTRSSRWWFHYHRLHRKLLFRQHRVQPVMTNSSIWRPFRFNESNVSTFVIAVPYCNAVLCWTVLWLNSSVIVI